MPRKSKPAKKPKTAKKPKQTQEEFETELKATWKQVHDARADLIATHERTNYEVAAAQERLATFEQHLEEFLTKGMFKKNY